MMQGTWDPLPQGCFVELFNGKCRRLVMPLLGSCWFGSSILLLRIRKRHVLFSIFMVFNFSQVEELAFIILSAGLPRWR